MVGWITQLYIKVILIFLFFFVWTSYHRPVTFEDEIIFSIGNDQGLTNILLSQLCIVIDKSLVSIHSNVIIHIGQFKHLLL